MSNISDELRNELGAILASDAAGDIIKELLADTFGEEELVKALEKQTMKSAVTLLTPVITELREKNTTKIIRLEKSEVKIDPNSTHEKCAELVTYLKLYKQAMIVGPTGSGKSTLASQVAELLKLDYASYSCNEEASKTELIGFNDLSGYNYPNFLKFYEHGGVLLIDEYDAMSPGMALVLNAAFDRSGQLSVPTRKENPIARKHKDFYCILAGNTWGHASVEYSGRDLQDRAFLDRFKMCRIFIDYDLDLEVQLVGKKLASFFNIARNEIKKLNIDDEISTRTIVDSATLLANGFKLPQVLEAQTLHWEKDDQERYMQKLLPAIQAYTGEGGPVPMNAEAAAVVQEKWA